MRSPNGHCQMQIIRLSAVCVMVALTSNLKGGRGDCPSDALLCEPFHLLNYRSSTAPLCSAYRLSYSLPLERQRSHGKEPNMTIHSLPILLLALFIQSTWSQQLQGPAMGMPYNVSASCTQALNTSVACPGALADVAAKWVPSCPWPAVNRSPTNTHHSGGIIDTDGISYLCETSCLSSLQSARSTIAQACTASTDVVVYNDIAYPGSQTKLMESATISELLQPHSSLIVTFTPTIWLAGKTGTGLLTSVV